MFRFCSIFLASVYSLMIKLSGLIFNYFSRSKSRVVEENGSSFSVNRSQQEEEGSLGLQKSRGDLNAKTEDSVFLQGGMVSNSSKCQVMSGNNVIGFFEEQKTVKFVVQEMLVGPESDDVLVTSDQNHGCEITQREDSLEQENLLEFDEESESSSFYFNLLNGSLSKDEDEQEHDPETEENDRSNGFCSEEAHEERESDHFNGFCSEQVPEEREKHNLHMEDEAMEDQDFSYEVELLPSFPPSVLAADQESDTANEHILISNQKSEGNNSENWMSDFLDEIDRKTQEHVHEQEQDFSDEEEYIELENLSLKSHTDKESTSCDDLQEQNIMQSQKTTFLQEGTSCWDSESDEEDEDEDEADVLSEHQNLVQQMKMELKHCRIKGLPTISEDGESPKMAEDLKPLEIDHKIEYKDVMEEIQKFYKSYSERMRKFDILNYQTLHAISFLQLKESEVFTAGKKRPESIPFVSHKFWARKDQRVYADPMHKSIIEMHRDLELVYVGQLCLSWEILSWLYVKVRDLIRYNFKGNRSYNRSAEEFQQFQVLMQRFVEDEQFKGHRNQNYVKNRCMIRSLLQVPTIKDDCLKIKEEGREETDAISLEMLVEIIQESVLSFRDFLFADKKSINAVLKGTKVDVEDLENLEILSDVISDLQKKDRRMREQMRSQNCIVKKLRRHQEWRLDSDILTCQVELRLLSRVLTMSRLTTDQLVWCKKKLDNISFVGRKVHMDPSFLLFPC